MRMREWEGVGHGPTDCVNKANRDWGHSVRQSIRLNPKNPLKNPKRFLSKNLEKLKTVFIQKPWKTSNGFRPKTLKNSKRFVSLPKLDHHQHKWVWLVNWQHATLLQENLSLWRTLAWNICKCDVITLIINMAGEPHPPGCGVAPGLGLIDLLVDWEPSQIQITLPG